MNERIDIEAIEEAVLSGWDLDGLAWNDVPVSDDPVLAMHELESRVLRLYGVVFETYIRRWHDVYPRLPALSEPQLKACLDEIFDEKAVSITRFLLRKHRLGETPLSLTAVAAQVYDRSLPGFRKSSSDFIKRLEFPATALGVWDVERVIGKVNGQEEVRGYRISPGIVLLSFERRVFIRERRAQLSRYFAKYPIEVTP